MDSDTACSASEFAATRSVANSKVSGSVLSVFEMAGPNWESTTCGSGGAVSVLCSGSAIKASEFSSGFDSACSG